MRQCFRHAGRNQFLCKGLHFLLEHEDLGSFHRDPTSDMASIGSENLSQHTTTNPPQPKPFESSSPGGSKKRKTRQGVVDAVLDYLEGPEGGRGVFCEDALLSFFDEDIDFNSDVASHEEALHCNPGLHPDKTCLCPERVD